MGMMDRETGSLVMSTAVIGLVYGVFQIGMPKTIDARVAPMDDRNLHVSAKKSAWMSAVVVSGLSLAAKDPVIFIFGSLTTIGLYWWYQTEGHTNPIAMGLGTQKIDKVAAEAQPVDVSGVYAEAIF